ncbi:MAG TPA: GTP 3',8-cyclase MoaA [Candidatus Sulfotelmatobacter sp.]|jgi:cyclic pyranopterin phosphate synthase|nr:GTP 3',8-cyclase MoaA [Candidatus Sulfotelmatobacter sp.]
MANAAMVDGFGRRIQYLRLSVIDRCDLRCQYCMAEEPDFLPKDQVLTLEEIARLAQIFIGQGVRKIRLTGGEPLVRRNVMSLVKVLGEEVAAGRLDELTLTTNGTQLAKHAEGLAQAGIRRINVSLDSLNADTFRRITRRGELEQVLDGIHAAKQAGLKIKINTVALKGLNDGEMDRLISWCGREGHDLTLIETMPLGEFSMDMRGHALPLDEVRRDLEHRWTLVDSDYRSGGPARYVTVAETGRRLGFITPLTHGFCDSCNRVRLTCTGQLVMCLGHEAGTDLRTPLRASDHEEGVVRAIHQAMGIKPQGHDFVSQIVEANPISRTMNRVGG